VHCSELFHPLGEEEAELVSGPAHPAMFSAVMRKAGVPKQLGRVTEHVWLYSKSLLGG
jgi:hypothetical protein